MSIEQETRRNGEKREKGDRERERKVKGFFWGGLSTTGGGGGRGEEGKRGKKEKKEKPLPRNFCPTPRD